MFVSKISVGTLRIKYNRLLRFVGDFHPGLLRDYFFHCVHFLNNCIGIKIMLAGESSFLFNNVLEFRRFRIVAHVKARFSPIVLGNQGNQFSFFSLGGQNR